MRHTFAGTTSTASCNSNLASHAWGDVSVSGDNQFTDLSFPELNQLAPTAFRESVTAVTTLGPTSDESFDSEELNDISLEAAFRHNDKDGVNLSCWEKHARRLLLFIVNSRCSPELFPVRLGGSNSLFEGKEKSCPFGVYCTAAKQSDIV